MGANQTQNQPLVAAVPEVTLPAKVNVENGGEVKPKCKACCACPETKRIRDECVIINGQENCSKEIQAHLVCMRAAGFNI